MRRLSVMTSLSIALPFWRGRRDAWSRRFRDGSWSTANRVRRSRTLAICCFVLALCGGLLTAQGMILDSMGSSRNTGSVSSSIAVLSVGTSRFGGLIGFVLSLGCGLAGLWCWPRIQQARTVPEESAQAAYDYVTGLPTIRLFSVLLNHAIQRTSEVGRSVGVLVVELSQFRPDPIAGTSPRATLVARVQAARIKSALQSSDTVAFLGDHRFAVLIETVVSGEQMMACAAHIQRALSLPLLVAGQEVILSCRIGGAMLDSESVSGDVLLARAVQSLALAYSDHPIHFSSEVYRVRSGEFPLSETPQAEHLLHHR